VIVVLVVVDSLRADAPGFAGGAARTPLLDRLVAEGTGFHHAVASAGWTVPSLVSMTTGSFPHRVGVGRWRHPFPRRRPSLFTAFAAAGFEVHTAVHNPRFAFANFGFRGSALDSEDPDAVVAALRGPRGVDRLVVVHHWWTHLPYRNEAIPRAPWRKLCSEAIAELADEPGAPERQRERYAESISWFDRELLPRYLDAASSSGGPVVLAVTGDHGENWGESLPPGRRMEHIYDLHGRWLTDDTTRVPLFFWGRGAGHRIPAGQMLGGFARGVDVAPTLAALAGVPWPGPLPDSSGPTLVERGISPDGEGLALDGLSLAACIEEGRPAPSRAALTVTSHNAIVPARYPRDGRRMWRRFGLRTADRRYQWDGQAGLRDVVLHPNDLGGDSMTAWDRLVGNLRPTVATWAQLARERSRGVGPGELLPKDSFPLFGAGDAEDDADPAGQSDAAPVDGAALAEDLRTLGYMD